MLDAADRSPLVIVKNLRAVETLSDQIADVALLYTAGLPGVRRCVASASSPRSRVPAIPDADLCGVRIAVRCWVPRPRGR